MDAYRIIGEERAGRCLVTCDHASNRVPDWVGGGDLGIGPADMARHIAYDVGAAGLEATVWFTPADDRCVGFVGSWRNAVDVAPTPA